ncbi:hypothetical protein C4J81_04710 [Deltaproteobacteria bacterium Smac51]|nr:hypothetical protein C4J81_04710 [Deltaproteobacteria bacterium Smac51]
MVEIHLNVKAGQMTRPDRDNPALQDANTVILCCNTLEDEIRQVLNDTGLDYPIVWLEAGMHNQPDQLRVHINKTLKEINSRRVLMALGHCGGACVGLETGNYQLIIPRSDDCLSLLLGSMEKRKLAGRDAATYFLTAGWLRYTDNLISSFARDAERFGREKAERVYKIMLKHYRRFGFIDTGAYDLEQQERQIGPLADTLNIGLERLDGDLSWLRRLLTGPWSEADFLIVPPNSRLNLTDWDWLGTASTQF